MVLEEVVYDFDFSYTLYGEWKWAGYKCKNIDSILDFFQELRDRNLEDLVIKFVAKTVGNNQRQLIYEYEYERLVALTPKEFQLKVLCKQLNKQL